jgi:hypothetical protein
VPFDDPARRRPCFVFEDEEVADSIDALVRTGGLGDAEMAGYP